jgi:hypothetical protein
MKKRDLRHLVKIPHPVDLHYTKVEERIEAEQQRLAEIAEKTGKEVVDINKQRKKA